MPYEIGTAYGYLDLMDALKQFAAGWPQHGGITPTITGNADLRYVRAKGPVGTTPLETWTVVCTTAGGDGVATFSVTGSTSGAQAAATAGTVYDNGIIRFLITGATGYAAVLSDQWVFTFATGAMDTSTEKWTILRDVSADLVDTDDQELILSGPGAPGGSDNIYVGIKNYVNQPADIYNWSLQGFTAYQAGANFHEQPGAIPKAGWNGVSSAAEINCPFSTFVPTPLEIDYWFVGNGRRLMMAATFEAFFNVTYLGWILPFYTPAQWNYPLFIGGNACFDNDVVRYSSTEEYNQSFWFPMIDNISIEYKIDALSPGRLLDPGGTWRGFFHSAGNKAANNPSETNFYVTTGVYPGYVWPYAKRGMRKLVLNIDGSYPHFPIKLYGRINSDNGESQCYGVLDGLRAISGFNNQQENTFVDGGNTWLIVRSANETALEDYAAMELK
jgi:hypothetical protein